MERPYLIDQAPCGIESSLQVAESNAPSYVPICKGSQQTVFRLIEENREILPKELFMRTNANAKKREGTVLYGRVTEEVS